MEKDERQEMYDAQSIINFNIFERLSAISEELSTIAKSLEIEISKTKKYKAVSEVDVLRAVKPLEFKYRIYSYPVSRRVIESEIIENDGFDYESKSKYTKKTLFERIETIYRFVNIDKPSEYIDITSYGDGLDVGDKGVGKAMTYADKYALLKAYKIVTGEDPDQELSVQMTNGANIKEKPQYAKNDGEDIMNEFNVLYAQGKTHAEILKGICDFANVEISKASEVVKKYVESGKANDLSFKQLKCVINEVTRK